MKNKLIIVQYCLLGIQILYLSFIWVNVPSENEFATIGQRIFLIPISVGGLLFSIGLLKEKYTFLAIILLLTSSVGILSLSDKFIMFFK